jgi:hypothetical protein
MTVSEPEPGKRTIATGGEGSHMTVEDAVSAQFAGDIPVFAKPAFERFRRTRHSAQYFDPDAAPITNADAARLSNRGLNRPSQTRLRIAQRGVKLVAVRVAEDEDVDIPDWTRPVTSLLPGGPGPGSPGRPRDAAYGYALRSR